MMKDSRTPRYTEDFGSVAAGGTSEDGVALLQQPTGAMSQGAASTDAADESQEKILLKRLTDRYRNADSVVWVPF